MSEHTVSFDAYTQGYFERNDTGLEDAASFLAFSSQDAFDRVFGFGRTMGPRPDTLPPDAFDASIVVAVIHRGGAIWRYQVEEVVARGGTLRVSYRADEGPASDGVRFASPLVVRLPRQGVATVQLIENGQSVATLAIAPR
jgi:hypothetical protein